MMPRSKPTPEWKRRIDAGAGRQMVWMDGPDGTYTYWFGPGVVDVPINVAEAYERQEKQRATH